MTILTPERLAEIEVLAKKATPGPWQHNGIRALVRRVWHERGCRLTQYLFEGVIAAPGDTPDIERANTNAAYIAALDPQTVLALLASHAALSAEVERLNTVKNSWTRVAYDLESELTNARESAAREMREALERIVNSPTIKSVCGWYDEIESARKLLSALPLTPADGAKDE